MVWLVEIRGGHGLRELQAWPNPSIILMGLDNLYMANWPGQVLCRDLFNFWVGLVHENKCSSRLGSTRISHAK